MRALFYADPSDDWSPQQWLAWSLLLAGSLAKQNGAESRIVTAAEYEPMARTLFGDRAQQFTFAALRGAREAVGLQTAQWYSLIQERGSYLPFDEVLALPLREALGGFDPDVVFTFTPSTLLRRVFPQARLLHFEYGPWPHTPFNEGWMLDPLGIEVPAYADRHAQSIASTHPLGAVESEALDALAGAVRAAAEIVEPVTNAIDALRSRYDRVFLLPLPDVQHFATRGRSPDVTPAEILLRAARLAGSKTAVVPTMHPIQKDTQREQFAQIRELAPNIEPLDFHGRLVGSTDIAAPFVDAVISTTTKAVLAGALHGKPIYPLLPDYMPWMSQPWPGEGGRAALDETERRAVIAWLLTCYRKPAAFLMDGRAVVSLIERVPPEDLTGPAHYDPLLYKAPGGVTEGLDRLRHQATVFGRTITPLAAGLPLTAVARRAFQLLPACFAEVHSKEPVWWRFGSPIIGFIVSLAIFQGDPEPRSIIKLRADGVTSDTWAELIYYPRTHSLSISFTHLGGLRGEEKLRCNVNLGEILTITVLRSRHHFHGAAEVTGCGLQTFNASPLGIAPGPEISIGQPSKLCVGAGEFAIDSLEFLSER